MAISICPPTRSVAPLVLMVIDCGVLFPEAEQPGIDLILPDFGVIEHRLDDITAVVLTHGHEDPIGAVPYLLRLRAEMRLPGLAWLEFHVEHEDADGRGDGDGTGAAAVTRATTRLRQRATFVPRGLLGHLYWWAVAPFHGIVFGGMLRNITRAAEGDGAT